MFRQSALRSYLIGSIVIWTGIFFATAVILGGTDHFAQMLPILSGGAFWFLVLAPALFRLQRKPDSDPTS